MQEETILKRVAPNSLEAEQSVVGAMLLDREAIHVASEIITADDFYNKQLGTLFQTMEEIEADGAECGNKKLRIIFNRNGAQMAQDEYIDMSFNGNKVLYEEAKQHTPQTPF